MSKQIPNSPSTSRYGTGKFQTQNSIKKATAWAPVNVALIKYWGKMDDKLRIPANSNIAICLEKLGTLTTVEFQSGLKQDMLFVDGSRLDGRGHERVVSHLDKIRYLGKIKSKAKVVSKNNFPKSTGLSASASGFAALTLAASKALGMDLNEKDLSRLARLGSGSACRSIPDGWVEWRAGDSDINSYARKIFPVEHWDVRILVVMLTKKEKRVSSTDGHAAAKRSPYYSKRLKVSSEKLLKLKRFIHKKDFHSFGAVLEDECLNMHAVMLTGKPNLIYWLPETVRVMQAVQDWRKPYVGAQDKEGLESYFTINTGQNVFVFCLKKDESRLIGRLEQLEGVIEVRRDRIGRGASLIKQHLF